MKLATFAAVAMVLLSMRTDGMPRILNTGFAEHAGRFTTQGIGYSVELTSSEVTIRTSSEFRLRFLGATRKHTMRGEELLPGRASYFVGSDPARWRTDVRRYGSVRYTGIYEGIDAVFHTRTGNMEYDWIVAPGADVSQIRMQFPDADNLSLDSQGDLLVTRTGAQVRHHRPVILQSERRIEGAYRLHPGKQVSFEVCNYDRRKPLIIDPVLTYSTLLGGGANDGGFSIAVDRAGNAWIAGLTQSADFPRSSAAGSASPAGSSNAFVAKLNAAGTELLSVAYLGGAGEDVALAIALDEAGNPWIAGGTTSTDFPTTAGAVQRAYGGTGGGSLPPLWTPAGDAFVAKLNAGGNTLLYASYLGSSGADQAHGIRVDTSGDIYIAGTTAAGLRGSPDTFPITSAAFQRTRVGSTDAFVAKLNAAGSALLYCTYLGGSDEDLVFGLDVNAGGEAYVTGLTGSPDLPVTTTSVQPKYIGAPMGFVLKLNARGSALSWGTFLGGKGYTFAQAVAVDAEGNAYVTGVTNSPDFPVTPGTFATTNRAPAPQGDVFVVKLDPAGSRLVYSSVLGGNGTDYGTAIAVDSRGSAYVAGRSFAFGQSYSSVPTTPTALQRCGRDDAFITRISPDGSSLLYSSHLGGKGTTGATGIAVGSDSAVWITGSTTSSDFPVTPAALQRTIRGTGEGAFDFDSLLPWGGDAFVARMDLTGPARLQVGCAVNGASFAPGPLSPGAIVSILGGGMGPDAGVLGEIVNNQVVTSLAGVRVLFDGAPAPLLFVRSDQINTVAPWNITDATQIQVEYRGERSNVISVPVVAAAPAVFSSNSSGVGQGAVLNQDGSVNSPSNPARAGSIVSVFLTGLGRTDPESSAGSINGLPLAKPRMSVKAWVSHSEAEVLYAGPAPQLVAGAFQVNLRIPSATFAAADTELLITASDTSGTFATSQDRLTIAVR